MSQNTCILEFCNYQSGYLKLYIPADKKSTTRNLMIELDDYLMEDGVPKNLQAIADRIKYEVGDKKIPPITLLLRCEETYKSIFTLPAMGRFSADALFSKEKKAAKVNPNYVITSNCFHHSLGYIYNTYFMPKHVIDAFGNLAKLLGTKIRVVEPLGFHLKKSLNYGGAYAYFYICKKVCTLLLVINKSLVTVYDFPFENERDLVSQFLLVISKHEFELSHKKIQRFHVESDEEITLDLGLADTEEKLIAPDGTPEEKVDKKVLEDEEIDLEIENDEIYGTTFSERHSASPDSLKRRYAKLAEKLLSYDGMRCQITEQAAVFHVNNRVYARLDIKGPRVCLYLAIDANQYRNTRYQCALSKRKGFESTPCLYRISTRFRQDGAYVLIDALSQQHGLVPQLFPRPV
ncbi:MAG: hypothetical protein IKC31_04710 [Clostridia bacterium]|nr:hypothetical protein [Clostridia bacterium]MBR2926859.1 hypothetical protein [Clostridia bacterium]